MRRRIKSIALTSDSAGVSRLLLAFAIMLITLFAWTLAHAAPVEGVKGRDAAYRVHASQHHDQNAADRQPDGSRSRLVRRPGRPLRLSSRIGSGLGIRETN